VLLLCADPSAGAPTIELDGDFVQGGVVMGRTEPGTTLTLGETKVRVSSSGDFLIGFGRDAPKQLQLRAVFPDGGVQLRVLEIAQREYKIQRIDGLPKRKVSPSKKDMKRIRAEGALINAARARDTDSAFFRGGFVWPVKGRISGVYGSQRILNGEPRRPHLGVDIAAKTGTPIVATADGIVRIAHDGMFFTGKTAAIDHGHGLMSIYAHMSDVAVKDGQRVAKGDPIGKVGATGRVTGPHLHWGVSWFKTRLDPALLVGPMTAPKPKS
jgi:murein DD-endopeptidase MepM/ murein hydrolase activator NlpD